MGEARDKAKGSFVLQVFAVAATADAEREEGNEGPLLMRPSVPPLGTSVSHGGDRGLGPTSWRPLAATPRGGPSSSGSGPNPGDGPP